MHFPRPSMPPGVRRRGRAGAAGGGGSGDSTHIICMAEARRISHLCKYMMLPPCISADKSCRSDGRIRLGYFSEVYSPLARTRDLSCPVTCPVTGQVVSLWKCPLRPQDTTGHRTCPISRGHRTGRLFSENHRKSHLCATQREILRFPSGRKVCSQRSTSERQGCICDYEPLFSSTK